MTPEMNCQKLTLKLNLQKGDNKSPPPLGAKNNYYQAALSPKIEQLEVPLTIPKKNNGQ